MRVSVRVLVPVCARACVRVPLLWACGEGHSGQALQRMRARLDMQIFSVTETFNKTEYPFDYGVLMHVIAACASAAPVLCRWRT